MKLLAKGLTINKTHDACLLLRSSLKLEGKSVSTNLCCLSITPDAGDYLHYFNQTSISKTEKWT